MAVIREKEVDLLQFRSDIDSWVKKFNGELEGLRDLHSIMDEHIGNVEHNYEIIKGLRDEVDSLREEVKLMRTIQIALIKQKAREDNLKN